MASFEILVPPLDGYQETQEAFSISPDELAITGLSKIGVIDNSYVKQASLNTDYGYVMPHKHKERSYWLRGLYLHEDEIYDPVGIPRRPEALVSHLRWYQSELQRLQKFGFSVVRHLPVIVKDADRWGEAGYGIFTLAENVAGASLENSLASRLARRQKPALDALAKLAAYYQDPERPKDTHYIRDICYMRQYNAHCLVDIDPLSADSKFPDQLAYLGAEASRLRSKEGKALHASIRATWLAQLDAAIEGA